MNQAILVGMGLVLLLFIWSWIGLVILNRMTLEKKIEKLVNITNPLPEEERQLRQLKDLRTIEQGKINSARWVVGGFMVLLVGSIAASPWWKPLHETFGAAALSRYSTIAIIILTFFCLPIFVGLSLASPGRKDKDEPPKDSVEGKAA